MPPRFLIEPLALVVLGVSCALAAAQGYGPPTGPPAVGVRQESPDQPKAVPAATPSAPTDIFRPFSPTPNGPADRSAQAPPGAAYGEPVPAAAQRPWPGQSEPGDVVRASFQVPAGPTETQKAGPEASTAGKPSAAAPEAPLPLAPRGRGGRTEASGLPGRMGGLSSLLTMGSSLAMVLGLFFVVAWVMRRTGGRASTRLPTDVVEILGHSPLAARQQVHLLRCGNKLLLVCVTPEGAQTLTEITDPDEVTRLAGLCRQAQPHSATAAFRQVFQQFQGEAGRATLADDGGNEPAPGRTAAHGKTPRVEDHHG